MIASTLLVLFLGQTAAGPPGQAAVDPALRAAVERFYAAQQAEDIEGYLALWSRQAQRPQPGSVKALFESGDDRFSEIAIIRAAQSGDVMRLVVEARRERSIPHRIPGRPPIVQTAVWRSALTYVREDGDWKLLREGSPADELAASLLEAKSDEEREAVLAAEPDLLNVSLLVALSRRGGAAAFRQAYPEAQAIYERVAQLARRIGAKREEGEALQNIANALYFQRRFPEALATYEARLAIERERGDDEAAASALVGIGTIRYSFAEYTEALAQYRRALAIQERVDDVMGTATTLIHTGNVRYLQGDFSGAILDYTRSLELQRRMHHKDGEARALEGLGRSYTAQGNYGPALEAFAAVLDIGRAFGERSRQGFATQSIAEVHFRLGNVEQARLSYEASRGHYEALRDLPNVGRVWQGLALTHLVAGSFAAAEQAYGRSIATCGEAGDRGCSARAIVGLAFAQSAQDKFVESIASYRKAISEFTALDEKEEAARAEIGLSQALSGHGDHRLAVESARHARATAVATADDDVLWRALTAEARALRNSGDRSTLETALGVARAAVGTIERLERAALDRPAASAPADATAGLATYAVLQAESGDAAGAFATAERLRMLDLRATLAANERQIARGMSADERQEERAAAMELTSLHAQLTREKGLPKPDKARMDGLSARIAEKTAARAAFMEKLFDRLPDLRVWRGLAPPPQVADVATVLTSPGTLIVGFVVDDDDVLVATAARGEKDEIEFSAHVAPVKRRDLSTRVAALQQPAVLGNAAEWRRTAGEFARLIPEAALARIASAPRVILLPHEMLWRVPFEALPVGAGYLVDRAGIAYATSVAALLRAPAPRRPAETGDALPLIVGAPELSATMRARLAQTAPGWTLPAADASLRDAQSAASAYGEADASVLLTGAAATEPAWRSHVPSAEVLHVAAPFRVNGASPLFSPILLAGEPIANDAADDGLFEAREVVNLDLTAKVAVLTDPAALSMRDGAGALGVVGWTWLAAGVPSVLVTRWPADSAEFVAEFHRALRDGLGAVEAARRARDLVRRRPATAAPLHWAGWLLIGTG